MTMTTRIGTLIGRYEIDAELGRGAMGVVYRGRDPRIDRTVAIKTISLAGLEPSEGKEYRARFVVEAKAAGRLSHPGIATIFDVGEPDAETPYLVMEFVEGQTLDKLLFEENNRLPFTTALRMAQELAEALHYAHKQGVVHRDIKPTNVLVTAAGHAKIADFGIAKLNQTQLTVPGQVLGTPAYMAPEQLSDGDVDGRSDLFSVGVILYSILTGHRPCQGNSAATVCFKLVNSDPVAVTAFNPAFPSDIDRIISRALAKDPDQRYQTGMDLANDLRQLRESCGTIQKEGGIAAHDKRGGVPRFGSNLSSMGPRAARPTRSWLARNGLIPSALLVPAVVLVTFSALNVTHPRTTAKTEPTVSVDDGSGSHKSNSASPSPTNGTLEIQIQHHFSDARASVWLDNRLVYNSSLHGTTKSHALVFRRVEGRQSGTIKVPSGKHSLRVRIQSAADHYDQSKTVDGAFMMNRQNILEIVCRNKGVELAFTPQRE
jgi:serine/threonine protein kinase